MRSTLLDPTNLLEEPLTGRQVWTATLLLFALQSLRFCGVYKALARANTGLSAYNQCIAWGISGHRILRNLKQQGFAWLQ